MKRSIATFLIIFLLIGQTGFTLATHYCGGQAVKTGLVLGKRLPDCGMNMMQACEMNTSDHDGPLVKREPCCANHVRTVEANKDILTAILYSGESIFIELPLFQEPLSINTDPEANIPQLANNSPPGLDQDRQILFQTFLI